MPLVSAPTIVPPSLSVAIPLLGLPSPTGNFEAYLAGIHSIALLTNEHEIALAQRWRSTKDLGAAQQLVLCNLRFVVTVARKYKGYGLPLADLVQEGTVGLMKAVRRFDPSRGIRLISYAIHWIRFEIHEFILRNWRIVRLATTKAQRKLFFKKHRLNSSGTCMNSSDAETLAHDLGIDQKVIRLMEQRLGKPDVPFDGFPGQETFAAETYLAATDSDPLIRIEADDWERQIQPRLRTALDTLDERSREIIRRRFMGSESSEGLEVLGREYGVSAERIRQIQNNALRRLRTALEKLVIPCE